MRSSLENEQCTSAHASFATKASCSLQSSLATELPSSYCTWGSRYQTRRSHGRWASRATTPRSMGDMRSRTSVSPLIRYILRQLWKYMRSL